MAKIFITGAADGLGQLCAENLLSSGHTVVLHARNAERAEVALKKNPTAAAVLIADLANLEQTIRLANEVNAIGSFDAVIHNAGVYQAAPDMIFAVNTLAPYILTSLIQLPKRLIYLSSSMHLNGEPKLSHFKTNINAINYADSKLHVLLLSRAVARKCPHVFSNVVNPGWVPTKMGGSGAPDNLQQGYATQAWLATSIEPAAMVSGQYFFHQQTGRFNPVAKDEKLQENFLKSCEEVTGVPFTF